MHQKHPKIARKKKGLYSTVEFAFVGTNCGRMEALMQSCLARLSEKHRVVAITGDHGEPATPYSAQFGSKQFFGSAAEWNEYDDHLFGSQYDLVLVNGNHYPAARQIVFVDAKKAGTLERRAAQLTGVAAVVLCPGETEVPSWLKAIPPETKSTPIVTEDTPILKWEAAEDQLFDLLSAAVAEKRPPLKALVLVGGQSSRMGKNKGELVYRSEVPEAERMANICAGLGLETFFSVADDRPSLYGYPCISDRFIGLGPVGAIATAFLHDPAAAWLVVACDLPLLEKDHLARLVAARDTGRFATAVQGNEQRFPEPLIAIYEPRAYARLLRFLSIGYACPRKLLINSDIATLKYPTDLPLTNANTPQEREDVLTELSNRG